MVLMRWSKIGVLALLTISSIIIVLSTLFYSKFGFDITDEGFYLLSISRPKFYDRSLTNFGFVYHFLYWLANGDLALLRQANIVMTYGLSWCVAYYALDPGARGLPAQRTVYLIISAAFATGGLLVSVIAGSWLPTPSYNSLTMQGLLCVAVGLLWLNGNRITLIKIGWWVIGLGGILVFMGKPTSALAVASLVLVYFFISLKHNIVKFFCLIFGVLLALLSLSLLMDGSPASTFHRLTEVMSLSSVLQGGHSLTLALRWEILQLNSTEQQILQIGSILLCAFALLITTKYLPLIYLVFGVMIVSTFAGVSLLLDPIILNTNVGLMQELLVWIIPIGMIAYALIILDEKISCYVDRSMFVLILVLMFFPYAYVFGTLNSYWRSVGPASFLWISVGLLLVRGAIAKRENWLGLTVFAVATQLFVILRIHDALEHPYRQTQALFQTNYELVIPTTKSKIIVEEDYGSYLTTAFRLITNAGFESETPMIDLSGQSPGLLYAVGAKSMGLAWLIGGYPGSQHFVEKSLARVSCEELSRAWILYEPGGPRSIPESVMSTFGADLHRDYRKMTSWRTSPGAGGYAQAREQHLLKPVRSAEIASSCLQERG